MNLTVSVIGCCILCTVVLFWQLFNNVDIAQIRMIRSRIIAYSFGRVLVWSKRISTWASIHTTRWMRDYYFQRDIVHEQKDLDIEVNRGTRDLDDVPATATFQYGRLTATAVKSNFDFSNACDPGPGNQSIHNRRLREARFEE